MIYIQRKINSNQLEAIKNDFCDFNTIWQIVSDEMQKPPKIFQTSNERAQYKKNKACYFIAGQMSDTVRKNENVKSRSLVPLDIDDLEVNYSTFLAECKKLPQQNFQFLIYPTISHIEKNLSNKSNNLRARIVVNLDRAVNSKEYAALIDALTHFFVSLVEKGKVYNADISNKTWAQIQGLYIKTKDNETCIPAVFGSRALKVDDALREIELFNKETEEELLHDSYSAPSLKNTQQRKRKINIAMDLLTAYFLDDYKPKEGERNQWYFSRWSNALYQFNNDYITIDDLQAIHECINAINKNSVNPLSQSEMDSILRVLD